jgi:hypothetical protein
MLSIFLRQAGRLVARQIFMLLFWWWPGEAAGEMAQLAVVAAVVVQAEQF